MTCSIRCPWQDSNLKPAVYGITANLPLRPVQSGLGRSGWEGIPLSVVWLAAVGPDGPVAETMVVSGVTATPLQELATVRAWPGRFLLGIDLVAVEGDGVVWLDRPCVKARIG
jgi:hypothetical protein